VYFACFEENNQVEFFLNKVPTTDLDYYSKIKRPIWLYAISEKIRILQYKKITEFVDDMNLLFQNFSAFVPVKDMTHRTIAVINGYNNLAT
jgi:hypothetical protein